jgi:hypothetical protein
LIQIYRLSRAVLQLQIAAKSDASDVMLEVLSVLSIAAFHCFKLPSPPGLCHIHLAGTFQPAAENDKAPQNSGLPIGVEARKGWSRLLTRPSPLAAGNKIIAAMAQSPNRKGNGSSWKISCI